MKFLYVLKPGKGNSQQEMRYSLRSIDKYHPDADVYVVGGAYKWMKGVTLIDYPDNNPDPIVNVSNKLKRATCELPSGTYVYMNDDFILLKPWVHANWYDTTIKELAHNGANEYRRRTMRYFCHIYPGDWLSYENHRPFSFDIAKAATYLNEYEYGSKIAFKTMMGNLDDRFPKFKSPADAKITDPKADYSKLFDILECISISESSWGSNLIVALKSHFPKKSRYEV